MLRPGTSSRLHATRPPTAQFSPSFLTSSTRYSCDMSNSTTTTSPHALESATTTDILPPAIHPSFVEASPSTLSQQPNLSPTLPFCPSCRHKQRSCSKSTTEVVCATSHLQPTVRDAATMTGNPEDHLPGPQQVEQAAYALPSTQADSPPAASHVRSPRPANSATTVDMPSSPFNTARHRSTTGRCTYISSGIRVARLHSTRQTRQQPQHLIYRLHSSFRHHHYDTCVSCPKCPTAHENRHHRHSLSR
ncbi:uncharacterized protein LOC142774459 [Rhipicephalus microplus]|uniref:uncharacterized protein LOC142774459 n=1 Tax=Rhipicephalus microplus TaxID=6941 RepID=UPI003F6D7F8E